MHMELRLAAVVVFPLYVKLLALASNHVYISTTLSCEFDEIHFLYKRKRDYRLNFCVWQLRICSTIWPTL